MLRKKGNNAGRAPAGRNQSEPQWTALFNGKDLNGWQVVGSDENHWIVEGRKLVCNSKKGGSWLATEKSFNNFLLELEFKVPPGGNSGVFLRAPLESKALEIQILDDHAEKFASLKPWQYTGSLYGLVAAKPGASKKAGEWQKMSIQCQGKKIRVTLNGIEAILADLEELEEQIQDKPGMKKMRGRIGLQDYGRRVEFRDIRLKPLK